MRPLRRPFGALPSIRLDMQIIRGKNRPAYGSDVTINHADHGRDATSSYRSYNLFRLTGSNCDSLQLRWQYVRLFSSTLRCRRCTSALLRGCRLLNRSPTISRVSKKLQSVLLRMCTTLVSAVWNFNNLMILIYILFMYYFDIFFLYYKHLSYIFKTHLYYIW